MNVGKLKNILSNIPDDTIIKGDLFIGWNPVDTDGAFYNKLTNQLILTQDEYTKYFDDPNFKNLNKGPRSISTCNNQIK